MLPIKRPVALSEETGSIKPLYCMAGMRVAMTVINMAAIWLRVRAEASSPMPVLLMEKIKVASSSAM